MGIAFFECVALAIVSLGIILPALFSLLGKRGYALRCVGIAGVLLGLWSALLFNDRSAHVLFFPEDTHYAAGFSEEAFRRVHRGQAKGEVLKLLGEPLGRYQLESSGQEVWRYATSGPEYSNYWIRIVEFDRSGKVVTTVAELYSD
jgi:outer membrane protein assembly factor BamE (lipoprotein component of BamABCDE complex)